MPTIQAHLTKRDWFETGGGVGYVTDTHQEYDAYQNCSNILYFLYTQDYGNTWLAQRMSFPDTNPLLLPKYTHVMVPQTLHGSPVLNSFIELDGKRIITPSSQSVALWNHYEAAVVNEAFADPSATPVNNHQQIQPQQLYRYQIVPGVFAYFTCEKIVAVDQDSFTTENTYNYMRIASLQVWSQHRYEFVNTGKLITGIPYQCWRRIDDMPLALQTIPNMPPWLPRVPVKKTAPTQSSVAKQPIPGNATSSVCLKCGQPNKSIQGFMSTMYHCPNCEP